MSMMLERNLSIGYNASLWFARTHDVHRVRCSPLQKLVRQTANKCQSGLQSYFVTDWFLDKFGFTDWKGHKLSTLILQHKRGVE